MPAAGNSLLLSDLFSTARGGVGGCSGPFSVFPQAVNPAGGVNAWLLLPSRSGTHEENTVVQSDVLEEGEKCVRAKRNPLSPDRNEAGLGISASACFRGDFISYVPGLGLRSGYSSQPGISVLVVTLEMASITDGKLVNNVVTLNKLKVQTGCLNIFLHLLLTCWRGDFSFWLILFLLLSQMQLF